MHKEHAEIPLQEVVYQPIITENTSIFLKPDTEPKSPNLFLYLVATIANLTAFANGVVIAWVTPVLPKLDGSQDLEESPLGRFLTASEVSWIAALLSFGATFGPLVTGKIADKIGRKRSLLILACLKVISLLIAAFAKHIFLFYISRFLMGITAGSIFGILPTFLAEIGENHNRGKLCCSMGIFVAFGLNFALIIGPYLSIQNFCLVCICPLLIFIPTFSILSTETPLFLATVNDQKGVEASLLKLRNKNQEEVHSEVTSIMKNVREECKRTGGIKDLIKNKGLRKGLGISLGLYIFQQSTGLGPIFAYMQNIFKTAGGTVTPETSIIIVGTFQVLGAILGSTIVDRVGRRILLLISSIGSCVSLAFLGLYFYLKDHQFSVEWLFWLPILCLVIFIVAFSIGMGSIPPTVTAELFPSNVRSVAAGLGSAICSLSSFFVIVTFPSLSLSLGMAHCFWIFSLISFISTLFIYWVLPETKGKSFEEIQNLLGNIKK